MAIFLWVLASLGVAYWAKLEGRKWGFWFILSIAITPLGGSIALMLVDRWQAR